MLKLIEINRTSRRFSFRRRHRTPGQPPIGALVALGRVQDRVVRHREDGFAIEFTRLLHGDFLENVSGE